MTSAASIRITDASLALAVSMPAASPGGAMMSYC
jgi:hypothetical protein